MHNQNVKLNTLPNTVSVSDFQKKARQVFSDTNKLGLPTLVLNRNEKIGVLLKPEVYQELVEVYEDYLDSLELEKAVRQTPKSEFKSWSSIRK